MMLWLLIPIGYMLIAGIVGKYNFKQAALECRQYIGKTTWDNAGYQRVKVSKYEKEIKSAAWVCFWIGVFWLPIFVIFGGYVCLEKTFKFLFTSKVHQCNLELEREYDALNAKKNLTKEELDRFNEIKREIKG